MKPLALHRRSMLRALASLGLSGFSLPALANGDPIAVVVSSSSRQRGLSSDKLRRIFLALPTDSDDGRRFIPINLSPTSGSRARFDRARGRRMRSARDQGSVGDNARQFNRTTRASNSIRDAAGEVAVQERLKAALDDELAARAGAGTGTALHLKRLTTF